MIKDFVKNNRIAINLYTTLMAYNNRLKLSTVNKSYSKVQNPSISLRQAQEYNLQRANGPQPKLCNAPFTSIFINMNGNVNVCGYNKSHIIGNVRKENLSAIWGGEQHTKLMDAITDYNLTAGCQLCLNKILDEDYHRAALFYDTPKADKTYRLKKIIFELSNLCNLECVMCNGELSSLIRKNREHRDPLELHDFENLSEQLTDFIPGLQFAQFLGGEPLLIKSYYKIWEKIIRLNKNCTISIQTNGTVLPKKFTELLDNSNQFIISLSIDSFNKNTYNEIRKNADFDVVMENFNILNEYKKRRKIEFSLNFVPMPLNWREIPDAVYFANKHELMLSMSEVDAPYEFSFFSQTADKLKEIIVYLEENLTTSKNNIFEIHNLSLFNNQITQLKHILLAVNEADLIYNEKTKKDNPETVRNEFENGVMNIPVYNHALADFLKTHLLDKLDKMNETQATDILNEFNKYFYLRHSFLSQQPSSDAETKVFERLVLNEFDMILGHIIQ